ncbi:STAS domain-containing protein [Pseudokineococcus marinus]|uniref:STAS domain-containing protein n=1 Tax=Pseudokineococcus marinus TaxID=351215 RepID=A0A849BSW8_9ACTN|nr:STAS domain-containing protein [Pseudokineococcus marinus]NNH22626.1 STAS domain-containing protein [Pseudokineococcus marinus]
MRGHGQRRTGDAHVVLHGDLDLGGCERWTAVLRDAVARLEDDEDLVVDARDVPFADCAGVRLLEDVASRAPRRVVLREPSAALTRVLSLADATCAPEVEGERDGGPGRGPGLRAVRAVCARLAADDEELGDRAPRRAVVRLSAADVAHPGTPGRVRVALVEQGLSPDRLELLVPAPLVGGAGSGAAGVERLRDLGCRVRAEDGSPLP